MKRISVAVAAVSVIASAAFVGFHTFGAETVAQHRDVIVAEGDNLLPSDTATDWVTYGDHLVMATVVAEKALEPTQEELEVGEGFIPRVVTFEIQKALWSREGVRAAPAEISLDLDGWTFQGDKRTPLRLRGEPMVDVGKTYLLPITYLSRSRLVGVAGWSNLSPDSILPYEGGVIGKGDTIGGYSGDSEGMTDLRDAVWGKSAASLVTRLNSTKPDPAAAEYADSPPDVRFRSSR